MVASSPLRSTAAARVVATGDRPKAADAQQERHSKLKVLGRATAAAEAAESWHETVNFAGKPRYDLHLRKEFYPGPAKDADLIKLKSMTVKYGPNGALTQAARRAIAGDPANTPPDVGVEALAPGSGLKDDTSSWGDSTIEGILDLGPLTFDHSPPPGLKRLRSPINDELPRTPAELVAHLGLDPSIALDLTSHPSRSADLLLCHPARAHHIYVIHVTPRTHGSQHTTTPPNHPSAMPPRSSRGSALATPARPPSPAPPACQRPTAAALSTHTVVWASPARAWASHAP